MVMRRPEYRSRRGASKKTLAIGGARMCVGGGDPAKAGQRKEQGNHADESTDRPGNSGCAGHRRFIGRRSDADATKLEPAGQDAAAGRHEVAPERTSENLRRLWRRF